MFHRYRTVPVTLIMVAKALLLIYITLMVCEPYKYLNNLWCTIWKEEWGLVNFLIGKKVNTNVHKEMN